MFSKLTKLILLVLISISLMINFSYSEKVETIEINGNNRISEDTILMFSDLTKNSEINSDADLNDILKKIYDTNFFSDVTVDFSQNILKFM